MFRGDRITIVVPNAAGGGFDIYARALAPVLERASGATTRVSNLSGGGGGAAALRVAAAPHDEFVLLLENASDLISLLTAAPELGVAPDDFIPLGTIESEPETWIGLRGLGPLADIGVPLVAAVASIESNIVGIGMVAMATGHDVAFVSGYSGTGDVMGAILRGETDFTSRSLGTTRQFAETGDYEILLIVADRPHPDFPDVPYLAGEGSLTALRTEGLDATERAERLRIADMAVTLSTSQRMLFTGAVMATEMRTCLAAAVDIAVMSDEFRDAAATQGRETNPRTGAATAEAYAQALAAAQDAAPVFEILTGAMRP